ncbi:uncharacterized protein [Struthio camelus]|uniref:uncharacterized protein n=1 Tax=Struthio camelus TaxID=8801 RepID=UPI003603CB7B
MHARTSRARQRLPPPEPGKPARPRLAACRGLQLYRISSLGERAPRIGRGRRTLVRDRFLRPGFFAGAGRSRDGIRSRRLPSVPAQPGRRAKPIEGQVITRGSTGVPFAAAGTAGASCGAVSRSLGTRRCFEKAKEPPHPWAAVLVPLQTQDEQPHCNRFKSGRRRQHPPHPVPPGTYCPSGLQNTSTENHAGEPNLNKAIKMRPPRSPGSAGGGISRGTGASCRDLGLGQLSLSRAGHGSRARAALLQNSCWLPLNLSPNRYA